MTPPETFVVRHICPPYRVQLVAGYRDMGEVNRPRISMTRFFDKPLDIAECTMYVPN